MAKENNMYFYVCVIAAAVIGIILSFAKSLTASVAIMNTITTILIVAGVLFGGIFVSAKSIEKMLLPLLVLVITIPSAMAMLPGVSGFGGSIINAIGLALAKTGTFLVALALTVGFRQVFMVSK